jgi:hypothetical protein
MDFLEATKLRDELFALEKVLKSDLIRNFLRLQMRVVVYFYKRVKNSL